MGWFGPTLDMQLDMQNRLVKELAFHGITTMETANYYLDTTYQPDVNERFTENPTVEGSAFVPWIGVNLDDYLSERFERTVGRDNCVSFEGMTLQIPANEHRFNYIKTKVKIHRYADDSLGLFHGPRKLATYDCSGQQLAPGESALNKFSRRPGFPPELLGNPDNSFALKPDSSIC